MPLSLYQVDAFTDRLFGGNPAAVCPLEAWLPDALLQQIAAENNLAETAFYVKQGDHYALRWFTPTVEVDLCGHATLAAAYVLYELEGYAGDALRFDTRSGRLTVVREGKRLSMDFPADTLAAAELSVAVREGLGNPQISETFRGTSDYLLVLSSKAELLALQPDFRRIAEDRSVRAVIVTAPADASEVDFVSRCFAPQSGIDEDPVTGSAHTTLVPYWAKRLGKDQLVAQQCSARGGILYCTHRGDRVDIAGEAVLYLRGEIRVPNQ
jgi:PhzF family phenazine biosynthesis protein